jgi:hypothetical protein
MGAMGGGGGINVDVPTNQMNQLLGDAQNNALNYTNNFTNQAIGAQNNFYQQAMNQILQSQAQATQQATGQFNQSQALQAPYRDAGYAALDNYMDTLMLARPEMGSQKVATYLNNAAQAQNQVNNLALGERQLSQLYSGNDNNPFTAAAKPGMDNVYGWKSLFGMATGVDPTSNNPNIGDQPHTIGSVATQLMGHPGQLSQGQQNFVNQYMQAGGYAGETGTEFLNNYMKPINSLYDQQMYNYNQLGQFLQNQYTPEQQKFAMAYNQGLFNNPTSLTQVH